MRLGEELDFTGNWDFEENDVWGMYKTWLDNDLTEASEQKEHCNAAIFLKQL